MIFLTGPHNSGKTTMAKKLADDGFIHVETGDVVRKKYKDDNIGDNFEKWAIEKNKEDLNYFDKIIVEAINLAIKARKDQGMLFGDVVITGNRQLSGIKYLIRNVKNLKGHDNIIIYLEVPEEKLYQRQLDRKDRKIAGLTHSKFKNEHLGFDNKMGLQEIKKMADYIIDADKPIGEVLAGITKILNEIGCEIKRSLTEKEVKNPYETSRKNR